MTQFRPNEGQLEIAAGAGAAAAMTAYFMLADTAKEGDAGADAREAAMLWFARGEVRDRDQDEDLEALATYAGEAHRLPETLWRFAVDRGAVAGDAAAFDDEPAEIRVAYQVFAETVRATVVTLVTDAEREEAAPKRLEQSARPEDRTLERTDGHLEREDWTTSAAAKAEDRRAAEQTARERDEAERAEADAKAEEERRAAKAEADAKAEEIRQQKLVEEAQAARPAGAKPKAAGRSKGRTKAERMTKEELLNND